MKKFINILFIIMLFVSFPKISYASTPPDIIQTDTEDFGNGFYGITTLEIQSDNTRTVKTASKTYTLKTSSGTTAASFKLTATFNYPSGSSALCTYVSHSTSISDTKWKFSKKSSAKSGNTASGTFTANLVSSGITLESISKTITLTCDKYGNIT
ncbi:MAG: hypothetical protein HFH49_08290 [Lachnospiraceae bacterium]|nr:hypothetical protein [Lachnospiraceae bacterium]